MAPRTLALLSLQLAAGYGGSKWIYAEAWEKEASAAAQARTWGGLCSTGKEQSPIDVVTSKAVTTPDAPLSLETEFSATIEYVKNNGHGVQVFETSPSTHDLNAHGEAEVMVDGQPKGYSMVNGAKYNFYQVHWHTPSENTVDGVSFPLEAHFVHQLDDPALVGGYHRLAVIGLLYELGDCNTFLDEFWEAFPEKKGTAPYLGDSVDFNAKLQEALSEGYYHWYGSLTTPPCTEGVSWNLLKKTQTVCQRQIDLMKAALGETQSGVEFNNRVPMPLNHRVVTFVPNDGAERVPPVVPADTKWKYANDGETEANGAVQTATWGGECATGHEQSPIDVVTADVVFSSGSGKPTITTHFSAALTYVKHTGYALQLFETSPHTHGLNELEEVQLMAEGQPKGYSMINGDKYNFYQVHWHTPSENTVNGVSFPLEAHFVHQLDDPALVGGYNRLAVIGLLYELGECNEFLDYFWNEFPEKKGQAAYNGEDIDLNEKLADELSEGYYHWWGSLTTPPCTEGVSWNLLRQVQTVCQRQIDLMKDALAAGNKGIAFNNRVPQPLNHRVVSVSMGDGKWLYAEKGEIVANAAVQEKTWGGLCFAGREQSPIDIVTDETVASNIIPDGAKTVAAISTHYTAALEYVKNGGYSLQLFETSPKTHDLNAEGEVVYMADGQPKGYAMINGAKYNFYQVHWHTPSENTVDGKSFPLEAHFVHQLDDPALVGGYHRLAVIGLLYELGECNTFLDYFWDAFPEKKGTAAYEGMALDFNEKLAAELAQGYWHWYGSLTTPPCTEGVNWNVVKKTQTVCERQLDVMKARLAEYQYGTDFNNRVPQPLYNRVVVSSGGKAVDNSMKWVYSEKGETEANALTQARTWGGICVTGHEQSPIDVVTANVVEANVIPSGAETVAAISTHFGASLKYLKNSGYAFQLFETSPHTHELDVGGEAAVKPAGQPKGYSMINGAKYNFYQVHWHTPSENTVDGKSFPLEAHFVHQLDDPALVGGYHRLAVIGLLYELDDECNDFLDYFWNEFPDKKGSAAYEGAVLDFNAKLATELTQGYYHWYGSLTTPPCTEGVNWNLLKVTQKVCQRQVDKLKNAMYGTEFNNRVTMPLNHRVVTLSGGLALKGNPEVSSDSTWKYANDGETAASAAVQAATWGGLCSTGREQSPINVVTADVADSCLGGGDGTMVSSAMTMETHYTAALSYVKHTGYAYQLFETSPHTHELDSLDEVQVMAEGQPKGHAIINGAKFNFYQVHWHAPSENTVDGVSFPMEAHFVHQLDDDALVGGYHRLAVIGLLYELSDDCNEFLDYFWSTFPDDKGSESYDGQALDFNDKLTAALAEGYYHWYGSLTTPPCTEGVSWNLLKKTEKVCQRQVDKLRESLDNYQQLDFNNRVVQPLNHRVVTHRHCDASTMFEEGSKWVYANNGELVANAEAQRHTWGGLCTTGREQSPIDIVTSDVVVGDAPPTIETRISAVLKYVKHSGYSLQLFETSPNVHNIDSEGEVHVMADGQPKGHSIINGAKYNFYQVHWHTPSENTIDGESFPLEAHFVHQLDDPALVGGYHRLAVIGLLYELSDDCNEFLDYFWDMFPENKGKAVYDGAALDFNAKLDEELKGGAYHWYGSLTTPPCTEGVSWNLLKVRQTVCQRQVNVMKAALAEYQNGIDFNNRVTMPLNHRVVILNGKLEPEPTPSASPSAEVQTTAGPTEKALPPCSEIADPFEPCLPDETVESTAAAFGLLAALAALLQTA